MVVWPVFKPSTQERMNHQENSKFARLNTNVTHSSHYETRCRKSLRKTLTSLPKLTWILSNRKAIWRLTSLPKLTWILSNRKATWWPNVLVIKFPPNIFSDFFYKIQVKKWNRDLNVNSMKPKIKPSGGQILLLLRDQYDISYTDASLKVQVKK